MTPDKTPNTSQRDGVSEERLISLRKQFSYRAYGESRDENDDRARECTDVATVCSELLSARAEIARLVKRCQDMEDASEDRCLSQEHAHAMKHLAEYGNNDIELADARATIADLRRELGEAK